MEEGGSNIGISRLTLPWSLLPLADYVASLGLGLQLTPTRGLTREDLLLLRDKFGPNIVLSYEGPWGNDTSFRGACESFKKVWHWKRRPLGDPLAFAGPFIFGSDAAQKVPWFKEIFPEAVGINFDETGAVEVSPKRSMTVDDYLKHKKVCVDTLHIGEYPFISRDVNGFMKSLVEQGCVKVVQVQTRTWSDVRNFAAGNQTYIRDRLCTLGPVLSTVPIIMEFFPHHIVWGGMLYGGMDKFLLTLKKRIKECIP